MEWYISTSFQRACQKSPGKRGLSEIHDGVAINQPLNRPSAHSCYFTPPRDNADSSRVLWKDVDEGWIRYDPRSGSTQLLAPLARFIVDTIGASSVPLSVSDIANRVLELEPDADRDQCVVEVGETLGILSEVQLIQTIQP